MTPIRPLGPLARLRLAIARKLGIDPRSIQRRLQARARKKIASKVNGEAKIYAQIMQQTLARMRFVHTPTTSDSADSAGGQRRRRAQYVRFERCYTSAEVIWLKVLINVRTLLGAYRYALPYGVNSADIKDPYTIEELCYATGRKVTVVCYDDDDPDGPKDYSHGLWLAINRLEGIEGVPNLVLFSDMLELYPADMSSGPLLLGVGKHRKPAIYDLEQHPHVLVAGSTQSGKSNLINSWIAAILQLTDPADVRFILIDLKRMELVYFADSPHLARPVVTEPEDACQVLADMVMEMKKRSKMMERQAKNLADWNETHPDQKLPRLIIVIDELATLTRCEDSRLRHEAARLLELLSNMGRSIGIHLWLCTQRPAKEVILPSIKTNMALVVAGKVPNNSQSLLMLDRDLAAKLPLHPGRFIAKSGATFREVQAPLITEQDIDAAMAKSRSWAVTPEPDAPAAAGQPELPDGQPIRGYIADPVGTFVSERCQLVNGGMAYNADLYEAYSRWCQGNGAELVSRVAFGLYLGKHYSTVKRHQCSDGARAWKGINILPLPTTDTAPTTATTFLAETSQPDDSGLNVVPAVVPLLESGNGKEKESAYA